MPNNKLFTNIITGTAIVASLTTGGMAGFKVLASKNTPNEVPELTSQTPNPSPTPAPTSQPRAVEKVQSRAVPSVEASASPSIVPISSDFPVASMVPGTGFDDDGDDEENELKHEDKKENKVNEAREHEDHDND